jgi:hypothetical protein
VNQLNGTDRTVPILRAVKGTWQSAEFTYMSLPRFPSRNRLAPSIPRHSRSIAAFRPRGHNLSCALRRRKAVSGENALPVSKLARRRMRNLKCPRAEEALSGYCRDAPCSKAAEDSRSPVCCSPSCAPIDPRALGRERQHSAGQSDRSAGTTRAVDWLCRNTHAPCETGSHETHLARCESRLVAT